MKLSDNEIYQLLNSARELSGEAADKIMTIYKPLVKRMCRKYFLYGAEQDDLVQEGMIGLFYAVQNWQPARGGTFTTFAARCVSNRILSAVKASSREKHKALNDFVSVDFSVDHIYSTPKETYPENVLIANESFEELKNAIQNTLTLYERNVLRAYLDGMSYNEIACALNKNAKSVDNALKRIKLKLRQTTEL